MPRAAGSRSKTKYPGIYRLPSGRYEYLWRDANGRQKAARADTINAARTEKAARERDAAGGVEHDAKLTVASYARSWVESYYGRSTRKPIGDRTRDEYRRDLERYVLPQLGRRRLSTLRRRHVRDWVAWLADDDAQAERHKQENAQRATSGEAPLRHGKRLGDATIRRIFAVLSACLQTAYADDLITSNWCQNVALPQRDALKGDAGSTADDEGDVKVFSRDELRLALELAPTAWAAFFHLLAGTGLRVSEALALAADHLDLNGDRPVVRVRRALVRGKDGKLKLGPPKSRHGRRDVPLSPDVAGRLRAHLRARPAQPPAARKSWGDLVFRTTSGTPHLAENVHRRYLKPTVEEAGASWAAFHAFRHTFASLHIAAGTNILKLSRLLGHHSPAFTLETYSHLMDDGLGAALDLGAALGPSGDSGDSMGTAEAPETNGNVEATIDQILSSHGRSTD